MNWKIAITWMTKDSDFCNLFVKLFDNGDVFKDRILNKTNNILENTL